MIASAWPLAAHFSVILQNPKIAFRDAELKRVLIEKDDHGQPRPRAGAFANVYKATYPGGKGSVAIRVFTSASPERRERYQAISEYLRNRRLESLVGFTYRDDGIRSTDGKWYPLVTMDWVPGETLYKWVRGRCLDRDRASLAKASELWVNLVKEMLEAKIAHGDLQHANVMVTDRLQLKLVDYDCMCVPGLVGLKNLEIGVDPYQHPERNEETKLTLDLDNFSALFILVALKALAASPDLWRTFVEQPQYDKLLIRREDLAEPNRSPLVQELGRSPDQDVRRLSQRLIELARLPIGSAPRLDEVLFSFGAVETLLSRRDFDGALDLLRRNGKKPSEAPPALRPKLQDAERRVACLARLEKAAQAGDEAELQKAYDPALVDEYPRAQEVVKLARQAGPVVAALAKLEAARQAGKWRDFTRTWDAQEALLAPRKSAQRFVPLVKQWRERNRLCDLVTRHVGQPRPNPQALEEAWRNLLAAGGHPELDAKKGTIENLLARFRAWDIVSRELAKSPSQRHDLALVRAWQDQRASLAGHREADAAAPRIEQARERLTALDELKNLAGARVTVENELALLKRARNLPANYPHEFSPRLRQAQDRLTALKGLREVSREPISDANLAEAWRLLGEAQGQMLVSQAQADRCRLAERRLPALAALGKLPTAYPASKAPQLDPKILTAWQDELFNDCQDARPWQAAQALALHRTKTLRRLKRAIEAQDNAKTAEYFSDPCLEGYPLSREWEHAARQARAAVKATRALLDSLTGTDPRRFAAAFDAEVIRRNAAAFGAHEAKLAEWVESEILPVGKIGLAPPLARRSIELESERDAALRVCWNWPEPRYSEQCVLAILKTAPTAGSHPQGVEALMRSKIDRKAWEDGGGSRVLHAAREWIGCYVAVWAIVDLGFRRFVSEPLVLGRIESTPALAKMGFAR